ncbi:hypothetical protein F4703DRAFT_1875076 [Phycomyces blakesleeanus]
MADSTSSGPIITYCVEYAETQLSVCKSCNRVIPAKSLRVGELFRKNKKEKKKQAKYSWWHFKCWTVPKILTVLPIEQFRGYPALGKKDQERVERVIKHGEGASWKSVNEKVVKEGEEEEEEEEKPKKKQKISKEADEDVDLTDILTGVQANNKSADSKAKKTKNAEKAGKTEKAVKGTKTEKPATKKKAKAEAPKVEEEPKQVLLPKEDQLELENIANEIQASFKADQKAKRSRA